MHLHMRSGEKKQRPQGAVVQSAQLGAQLLQQGISAFRLSCQLFNHLVGSNNALNAQTGSAVANLASALAGGETKITIGGSQSSGGG